MVACFIRLSHLFLVYFNAQAGTVGYPDITVIIFIYSRIFQIIQQIAALVVVDPKALFLDKYVVLAISSSLYNLSAMPSINVIIPASTSHLMSA